MLHTLAKQYPLRAILIALLIIILADWAADDGCDCSPKEVVRSTMR